MSSVNKAILLGNLGKDPEVRFMQSGDKICNLTVATSESWKDKTSGEKKERTEWHRVVIFNQGIATIAERYLKKGSKVYLEGQIETRKYTDKDGVERYTTEIVLRPFRGELTLLGSLGARDIDEREEQQSSRNRAKANAYQAQNTLDDEIPF